MTDLALAWEFYVETLGIPGRRALGPGKPFELVIDPQLRVLVYLVSRLRQRDYPAETGVTLVFHTPDISRTMQEWQAAGVTFIPIAWSTTSTGVAETPFGPFIAFRDPFGNVHELLQPTSA